MIRPGAHLLIISHTFPPYKGIGGRRWAKFAKALARRGFIVHVIHSAGGEDLKGSFWTEDIAHPGIIVHPLPQRYPTVLFKRPLATFRERLAYRILSHVLPLLVRGNWLDKTVFWERALLHEAGALIGSHAIEHVIITGAPFRLFHYGVELKRRHSVRLLCDLRDPWTWHGGYGQGLLTERARSHERRLEGEMMENADVVTSPHASVIDHLREQYPGQAGKCRILRHAIDPDELGQPQPPRNDGIFRMIYSGSLYGAQEAEAYFDALLGAFQRTRELHPEAFKRCVLDLYITGHDTAPYKAKVKAAGLNDTILFHAPRIASKLFPRVAQADLVLIFIPSINKDLLGTKFTEIFHLRRPVVHIGMPGLVSETIVKNKLGISLQVEALATELPALISGERKVVIDAGYDLSGHLLENITERLVREVLV